MASLALVAALAAQAATQTGAPPPVPATTPSDTAVSARTVGQSTYVDLEAGAGYSTNPLQEIGSSRGSAFGRLSAHVVHTRVTDRTTTILSGFAQSVFYTGHYGSAQSFDLNARHDAAVSEKLRVFVDGDVAYDRGGQLDTRVISVPEVAPLPGTIIAPVLQTPGADFLSVTGKTYRANADLGGQLTLDPRDFLDFSAGIAHDIFKNGVVDTRYTSIPLAVGYDRQLSDRATVGARVVAQFNHYSGDLLNVGHDFNVITPEVTGQLRLSEQLTFSGDVGASFSSVDEGSFKHHSVGLAADARICSTPNDRTQFCAVGSVQQQAATSAGPSRVFSLGVDYSRRLTADDTLQFSVSGQHYSNTTLLFAGPTLTHATYVRAAVDYSRRISDRLFGGVDLAARKITQSGPDPRADLSAALFLRYRLGDVR